MSIFSLFRRVEVGSQCTLFNTTWPFYSVLAWPKTIIKLSYIIKPGSMSQVRTRSRSQSREERVLEEAESSNGWSIFLLHRGSQGDLQAILNIK